MSADLQALVGRRIAQARAAKGISQRQLADAVGAATRTVQSWEGGERIPRSTTLALLAEVLGQTPGWFYQEHDDEPVPA